MPETTVTFYTDAPDASSLEECPDVGSMYEVAINGQGYMLYDGNQDVMDVRLPVLRRQRQLVNLTPPRFATTNTPFSEAIDRYTFIGYADFRKGAGQQRLDRPASDPALYRDSDGINPFTDDNVLQLLPAVGVEISDTYATSRAVTATKLYAQTDDAELSYITDPGDSPTAVTIAAATLISDLASDGRFWYAAAAGDGIFRGTTTDPGAAWSSVAATVLGYAGQRICAAYPGSGSSNPNVFTTLNDQGAEELTGGRMILPSDYSITSITGGNGFIYFSAYAGETGAIYAWQLGSDSPFLALPLPVGQVPTSIFFYQGNLMVRASSDKGSGDTKGWIYRCVDSGSGVLTPFLVTTIDSSGEDDGAGAWGADGRFVYFSWTALDGTNSGLGCIDLSSGGYSKWLKGTAGGLVRSILHWKGQTYFSLDAVGVYGTADGTYVQTGWLQTSVSDLASGVEKIFDTIKVSCLPITSGQTIAVDYTLDEGASYVSLDGATINTAGQRTILAVFDKKAASVGLRITLTSAGTDTPSLIACQVQCHAVEKADVVLILPIDCGDKVSDLRNRALPDNGEGKGAARARTLESLAGTRVKVQDVDWPTNRTSEIFEVEAIQSQSLGAYDQHSGRGRNRIVAVVSLRKKEA